eukprot:360121-Chlamydomonas_euryale.AAC.6
MWGLGTPTIEGAGRCLGAVADPRRRHGTRRACAPPRRPAPACSRDMHAPWPSRLAPKLGKGAAPDPSCTHWATSGTQGAR